MPASRQWLSWLAVAALVAAAVATAGWGNDTTVRRHPEAGPGLTPVSAVRPLARVTRADLRLADLPSGYREVRARAAGDLDRGDIFRVCGRVVPRPLARVASHRRAFLADGGRRVRTEIGVYAPGGAARALDALRTSTSRCARAVPPGHVELPSVLALHVRLGAPPSYDGRRELVALRSGDALALLETDGTTPAETIDLARRVASRLG